MSIKDKLIQALLSKYEADYNNTEATLSIYMNNPVGIGEHPQHLEEMDKLVNAMVQANDNKEMVIQWKNNSVNLG
tara:strand:+ start:122 stop:346 length:225 start_codon:yes stop_codon:yes gene_type:complete